MKKKIAFFLIICLSVIKVYSQDVAQLLNDADYFYENEYYQQAIETYNRVLKINSQNTEALVGQGKVFIELNKPDIAKLNFENAIKIDEKNDEAFYNLGRYYHFLNDFENALKYYSEATKHNKDSALYFLAIAQTYKDKNVSDSAFLYFEKTISVKPNYSDAYYYKSYYNYELGNIEDAFADLQKGLEITPNDIYLLTLKAYLLSFQEDYETSLEICNLILSDNPLFVPALEIRAECYFIVDKLEEAINDAEFVYFQDTTNFRSLIILSWSNYYLGNYAKSIMFSEKGKLLDYYYIDFYTVKGMSLFYSEKYEAAIEEFDKAIALEPDKMDYYDYKIQAILLKNTDENVLDTNNVFTQIKQTNLDELDSWSNEKENKYSYIKLLNKFYENNSSLSIDEYFMLYYGQSLQEGYAPYAKTDLKKIIRENFSIGKYEETITIGEELLKQDPFLIDAYQYIAYSYLYLKQYDKYEEYLIPYHGFLSGIMASGNGNSAETAYIVTSVTDEYSLLYFMGLFSVNQTLIQSSDNYYDVLLAKDYYDNNSEIYFNINKPYNTFFKKFSTQKRKWFKRKK